MDDSKQYAIKTKINGQYFTLGNLKKNQWGNWAIGLKNSPELQNAILGVETGKWLNLNVFEERPRDTSAARSAPQRQEAPQVPDLNDDLPF